MSVCHKCHVELHVSIHAPTWGATLFWARLPAPKIRFQSTRPRGARLGLHSEDVAHVGFNPRAHVGRDYIYQLPVQQLCLFQSTRPRGARPAIAMKFSTRNVSIHAPTWGATKTMMCTTRACVCFNPRAHVGRDCIKPLQLITRIVFQSTRPRGARLHQTLAAHHAHRVSIHAPTWGATLSCRCHKNKPSCFNPRAHVGRDLQQGAHRASV